MDYYECHLAIGFNETIVLFLEFRYLITIIAPQSLKLEWRNTVELNLSLLFAQFLQNGKPSHSLNVICLFDSVPVYDLFGVLTKDVPHGWDEVRFD